VGAEPAQVVADLASADLVGMFAEQAGEQAAEVTVDEWFVSNRLCIVCDVLFRLDFRRSNSWSFRIRFVSTSLEGRARWAVQVSISGHAGRRPYC
jgi:hypothetical protein